jgi:hypothetical protein
MRVLGYVMLHYGLEYLEYVIRAIDPFCEKIMIFYTPVPTHNSSIGVACPEKEEDLKKIALSASGKIQWINVSGQNISNEGKHRNLVFAYAKEYDLVLNADSDEVWNQDALDRFLKEAADVDSRYIGVYGFVNFYRSFNWVVTDGFYPIRIHNMHSIVSETKTIGNAQEQNIYHFGYAQREEIVKYKIGIHGHRGSWKKNWLKEKFLDFDPLTTTLMHPDSEQVWVKAETFDKTTLPEMLKSHPYYNLEKI